MKKTDISTISIFQPIEVKNETNLEVIKGEIHYTTIFCSNDYFTVKPRSKWKASSRGACLIIRIIIETKEGVNFDWKPIMGVPWSNLLIEDHETGFRIRFTDDPANKVSRPIQF